MAYADIWLKLAQRLLPRRDNPRLAVRLGRLGWIPIWLALAGAVLAADRCEIDQVGGSFWGDIRARIEPEGNPDAFLDVVRIPKNILIVHPAIHDELTCGIAPNSHDAVDMDWHR